MIVMARAGMLRLLCEHPLQNLAGLELILVGLVETVGGGEQRQRVEDPRFTIVGVALRDRLHLAHVGGCARAVIELVVIGVEGRQRVEIVAFARRLRAQRQRLRDGVASFLQVGRRRRRPNLVPDAHGDTPIRHGAIGFGLGDRGKFLQRLPVPERVQGRERGIEARLNVGAARDGKAHVPSAALHQIMGVALGGGAARRAERKHRGKSCNKPRSCLGPAPNPGAIDRHGSTPMRFRLLIIGQFERSAITRRLLRRPIIVATWRSTAWRSRACGRRETPGSDKLSEASLRTSSSAAAISSRRSPGSAVSTVQFPGRSARGTARAWS